MLTNFYAYYKCWLDFQVRVPTHRGLQLSSTPTPSVKRRWSLDDWSYMQRVYWNCSCLPSSRTRVLQRGVPTPMPIVQHTYSSGRVRRYFFQGVIVPWNVRDKITSDGPRIHRYVHLLFCRTPMDVNNSSLKSLSDWSNQSYTCGASVFLTSGLRK